MYVNRHDFRVRYNEVDRMKIAYHGNYIAWFEIGRTEFLRSLGYNYRELEEQKIWLPVIEVNSRYRSPACYDDIITIETRIEDLGRVKIKFAYKIYNGEHLLTEGSTTHGITNDVLKPVALNKVNPELYKRLADCLDE